MAMLTSSLDSESLVRRHVCGLWASLWSEAVGRVVDYTTRGYRIAVGTAAGGQRPLGGLLTTQLGVIGSLSAPRQVARDRWAGC